MKEVVIEVNHLEKSYHLEGDSIPILDDINLAIHKKDFVTVMGPSGSGKSTLLYLIGGLDHPTAGNVKLFGKDIHKLKDRAESIMRRRDIGFIFQFYNLIPNLNVEENIMLPILLDNKKPKDYAEKLKQLTELVGLSHRRKFLPAQLSGGQQQRVAIARALINDPEVLLADEPTGNLDTVSGMEVMELLKKINREKGKTIIMVTHSREAATYGSSSIFLRDGKICRENGLELYSD